MNSRLRVKAQQVPPRVVVERVEADADGVQWPPPKEPFDLFHSAVIEGHIADLSAKHDVMIKYVSFFRGHQPRSAGQMFTEADLCERYVAQLRRHLVPFKTLTGYDCPTSSVVCGMIDSLEAANDAYKRVCSLAAKLAVTCPADAARLLAIKTSLPPRNATTEKKKA